MLRALCVSIVFVVLVLAVLVHAQSPALSCEDRLSLADKLLLVLRDERERAQQQFASVWLRAEKAEAEVARLKAQAAAGTSEGPGSPEGIR